MKLARFVHTDSRIKETMPYCGVKRTPMQLSGDDDGYDLERLGAVDIRSSVALGANWKTFAREFYWF